MKTCLSCGSEEYLPHSIHCPLRGETKKKKYSVNLVQTLTFPLVVEADNAADAKVCFSQEKGEPANSPSVENKFDWDTLTEI